LDDGALLHAICNVFPAFFDVIFHRRNETQKSHAEKSHGD